MRELITICNVLCIYNFSSLYDLIARIISKLCDLNVLKSNILHEDIHDTEIELLNKNVEILVIIMLEV